MKTSNSGGEGEKQFSSHLPVTMLVRKQQETEHQSQENWFRVLEVVKADGQIRDWSRRVYNSRLCSTARYTPSNLRRDLIGGYTFIFNKMLQNKWAIRKL